jgi:hypothetical protein
MDDLRETRRVGRTLSAGARRGVQDPAIAPMSALGDRRPRGRDERALRAAGRLVEIVGCPNRSHSGGGECPSS